MNTLDSFVTIGHDHFMCQDYAVVNKQNTCVVLSDGCSSAPLSDWGSRLLVRGVEIAWGLTCDGETLLKTAHLMACRAASSLGLPDECLRATLLCAAARETAVHVNICGDGCIIARRRSNQEVEVYEHEYTTGAPYYLAYTAPEQQEQYIREFGDGELLMRQHIYDFKDGQLTLLSTRTGHTPVAVHGQPAFGMQIQPYVFYYQDYDLVLLASDGLKSFTAEETTATSKRRVLVPFSRVLERLLQFKGYAGAFVQRRCQKAFRVEFPELGWQNMDDFSFGGVFCDK